MTAKRIAELDDQFRKTFPNGSVLATNGIAGISEQDRRKIFIKVHAFDTFSEDNPFQWVDPAKPHASN
jgi:hypothetical protein